MSDIQEATSQLLDVNLHENQRSVQEAESDLRSESELLVTIGATVPTGFEQTAADEVREKLGSSCKISRDRGKIYFVISVESLAQVHCLRSVDNLFVVVQEFQDYQFKKTKEEVLKDFEDLARKLPWSDPLKVWKINTSFKKKKTKRKKINQNSSKEKIDDGKEDETDETDVKKEFPGNALESHILDYYENPAIKEEISTLVGDDLASCKDETDEGAKQETESQVLKFRVTCNRAGEKHCFTSNEAARDFGGAIQDYFQWKADMTDFDVEVLLNIHGNEIIVGIALTEESLHRRNITHFGPTTLRSTLAYGMLRLCDPLPYDIIVDPMCGTGAIPIEETIVGLAHRCCSMGYLQSALKNRLSGRYCNRFAIWKKVGIGFFFGFTFTSYTRTYLSSVIFLEHSQSQKKKSLILTDLTELLFTYTMYKNMHLHIIFLLRTKECYELHFHHHRRFTLKLSRIHFLAHSLITPCYFTQKGQGELGSDSGSQINDF
ncbi:tRNA (guanine(6)-N2)-methyltransferase THUMP3 isoform X4 [Nycticebus coucang]|uniref:tRNA (guanine(6)-N2)-methyltransferase THUMP3 isoform X4 n=1 Tax=Nycticebus coucang TaxID=9470 RepID=UPI00234D0289|nr:tRNA (guanine(6)-N2)-methyltransferase THUMP3 isoform X4 [Nycticebus coucang]